MSIWAQITGDSPGGQSNDVAGADAGTADDGSNAADSNAGVSDADFVFYPRAYVSMSVTLEGTDELDTGIIPTRASVTLRPHNQASEAVVTVLGSALPFDPRQIAGIFLTLFIGSVSTVDEDVNQQQFLRFVGFSDEMEDKRDDKGPVVELKARDMSAILRDFHPLPATAQPSYSDTVGDAINAILSATPGASGRITLADGDLTSRQLSTAVPSRSQQAKVNLPPNCTAWQAVEHVAGLVSLLVSVDKDQIVLREPTAVYQNTDDPQVTLVFGGSSANTISVNRTKKFVRNRKGVRITAYDPTTRTTLTSDFPADADLLPTRRPPSHVGGSSTRAGGSSRSRRSTTISQGSGSNAGSSSSSSNTPERDVFAAPQGIHTQDALDSYAQRIYTERSQQEIEGTIVTPVWTQEILALKNASRFKIQIDPDLAAELRNTSDEQAAVDLLTARLDITDDAARALIRASLNQPTDQWYARTVTMEFDADGVCQTSIDFINLIQIESTSDTQSSSANSGQASSVFQ